MQQKDKMADVSRFPSPVRWAPYTNNEGRVGHFKTKKICKLTCMKTSVRYLNLKNREKIQCYD